MKLRIAALAAAGLFGAAAFAGGSVAGPEYKNQYPNSTDQPVMDCEDGDEVAFSGPDQLWPPNHKLQNATITATDGDETSMVGLELVDNGVTFAGEKGSGGPNHDPDVIYPATNAATGEGAAAVTFQVRAERSGQATDGRTYVIDWVAEFDNGAKVCASATDQEDDLEPFEIHVPHDMSEKADRDGRTEIGKGGDE